MKLDTAIIRRSDVRSRRVDDEMFLIDETNGSIHKLNAVSAAVWELLERRMTIREVVAVLHDAFPDTKKSTIKRDVKDLIDGMMEEDLIETC